MSGRVSRRPCRLAYAFAIVVVSASHAWAAGPAIRLRSRTFVPTPNVPTTARPAPAATPSPNTLGGRRHYLLQFENRVTRNALDRLRAVDVIPLRVVPDNGVAVAAPPDFDPSRIPGVRWIGVLEPNDKLSVESRGDIKATLAVRHPFTVVEFHPDTTATEARNLAFDAGATIVDIPGLPDHMLVIHTNRSALLGLLQLDEVAWIFPASRQLTSGEPARICAGLVSDGGVVAAYATEGDGWDGPGRNAARLGYFLSAASPDLSASLQGAELTRAMNEWARYVAVDWYRASNATASRAVNFLWGPTDHGDGFPFAPGILAHAFFPVPPSTEPLGGDVHFNDEFLWGASQAGAYDVFSVALHELGHSLGLNHSSDPDSVMYPSYQGIVPGLSASDIQTIQTLYARRDPAGTPSLWATGDIGTTTTVGSVAFSSGTIVLKGSGFDVWGVADEFTFASEPLRGDGDIVARVDSFKYPNRWAKVGVMIRDGRAPSAAHAFMLVSGGRGLAFQRRRGSGQTSLSTDPVAGTAPKWIRLARRGDRFEAYAGDDGQTWRLIGVDTIRMGETVDAGLALTSHLESATATAVFSNVTITPIPQWKAADIGAVGLAGSQVIGADKIDVLAAGPDIWARADAFRFVWRPMWGDGEIVARVASVDDVRAWAKAGVMIRASLDPGAAHAFVLVSAGKGLAFQRRVSDGGETTSSSGGAGSAPAWVRLVRRADTFSAYISGDGRSWRSIGSQTIAMGSDVLAGLAVSSHTETARCRAVFDSVQLK